MLLFVTVLEDADLWLTKPLPKRQQRLPDLSRAEVSQLAAPDNPTQSAAVAELLVPAGCGVSELVNIRVQDIDGSRRILHVVQGKGQKTVTCPYPTPCWHNGGLTGSVATPNSCTAVSGEILRLPNSR